MQVCPVREDDLGKCLQFFLPKLGAAQSNVTILFGVNKVEHNYIIPCVFDFYYA